ncbi:MAG TPA: hypothetical protein VKV73_04105 [Chloroflexota bacterium]|nr:hypothetical protein [Chloroflexota bacterium]
MNVRNRASTALVAALGLVALLAPTVSEAAPAITVPGVTSRASATTASVGVTAPTRVVEVQSGAVSVSTPGSTAIPYYVYLDSFHITNTRALENDTDLVDLTAMQPPAQAQSVTWGPQDVGDGDHAVGIALGPYAMASNSSSLLTFNYSIVNNGFGNTQSLLNQMTSKGVAATAAAVGGVIGGPVGAVVGAGADYLAGLFASVIFPNCDGVVATDIVGPLTGAQLASLTASGDYRITRHYAGTNSPVGCGSNSSYDVSWRISQTPPPPPSTGGVGGAGGQGSGLGGGKHLLN